MCNCANWQLKFELYVGKPFQCRDLNLDFFNQSAIAAKEETVIPNYNACSLSIVTGKL